MGDTPRPLFGRVLYHLLCGETELAADWYQPGDRREQSFTLIFAPVPPADALRASARWPKLAKVMNLPDAAV